MNPQEKKDAAEERAQEKKEQAAEDRREDAAAAKAQAAAGVKKGKRWYRALMDVGYFQDGVYITVLKGEEVPDPHGEPMVAPGQAELVEE